MFVLAVRQRQTCGACGAPVPIARLFDAALCPKCDAVVEFDDSLLVRLRWDSDGASTTADAATHLEAQRRDATCPHCEAFLPDVRALPSEIACRCGAHLTVRRIADGRLEGVATHALGEAPEGASTPLVAPEALTVHCSTCGGPVDARGEARSVRCGHCGVEVVVPDNIWARLHPTRVSSWIYLWRPPKPVEKKEPESKGVTFAAYALIALCGSAFLSGCVGVMWWVDAAVPKSASTLRIDRTVFVIAVVLTILCAAVFGVGLWRASKTPSAA